MMLSLVPLLLPSPALACGGMFCDTSTATTIVVQAAERIVFSFDEGMLDTEVQVRLGRAGAGGARAVRVQ